MRRSTRQRMEAIEVANRLVERQNKTIRRRLEQVLKIYISITDPIASWYDGNQTDGAKVPSQVRHVGNGAETRSLTQDASRVGHSDASRSGFECAWANEDVIKAMATAEKDARQTSSSATTVASHSTTHTTSGSTTSSSGPGPQTRASSETSSSTSTDAVSAKQDCIVGCFLKPTYSCSPNKWTKLGWALEKGSLMHPLIGQHENCYCERATGRPQGT